MQQSRRLNIVKAICIILMVAGHCEPPEGIRGFIYLFHMPAFFFLSGWLLKDSWFDNPLGFIKKRLGSLYAPYVFWELVFLLLSGVFYRLHLTDTQPTLQEMLSQAARFVTFRGHQPLLNGFWFLKTLFFCSVGCLFLLKFVRHGRLWLVAGLVACAGLCRLLPFDATMLSRLFMACAFYVTGFLASRLDFEVRLPLAITALGVVAVVSLFWHGSIFTDGWAVLLYYPVALIGTAGVFGIARSIDGCVSERAGRTADWLALAGRATLTILTFHFLSFKLVSLLKIALWGLPIDTLAEFPVIHAHNGLFWMVYSVVGVALPLGIYTLRNRTPRNQSIIKLF